MPQPLYCWGMIPGIEVCIGPRAWEARDISLCRESNNDSTIAKYPT